MKFDNIKVTENLYLSETIEQALLMLDDYLDGKSIATVYEEDEYVFVAHGFLSAPTRIDTEPHLQVMGIIQDLDSDEDYRRHVNRVSEELSREVYVETEEDSNAFKAGVTIVKYICITVAVIFVFGGIALSEIISTVFG